jgi:hypothetical protein
LNLAEETRDLLRWHADPHLPHSGSRGIATAILEDHVERVSKMVNHVLNHHLVDGDGGRRLREDRQMQLVVFNVIVRLMELVVSDSRARGHLLDLDHGVA